LPLYIVICSNDKEKARLKSLKVILSKINYKGRDMELNYALDQDIVISGARELEIIEAERTKQDKFIC